MNRSILLSVSRGVGTRLLSCLLMIVAVGFTQACAARDHVVRGTVTVVHPTRIDVRHRTGQIVSIAVNSQTTYRWDHTPASLDDVRAGTRVLLVLDEHLAPFSATEVRILRQPRTEAKAPRSPSESSSRSPLSATLAWE